MNDHSHHLKMLLEYWSVVQEKSFSAESDPQAVSDAKRLFFCGALSAFATAWRQGWAGIDFDRMESLQKEIGAFLDAECPQGKEGVSS